MCKCWDFTYLLLTKCLVLTVIYGLSFFPHLMAQAPSARAIKRGEKPMIHITYGTDQANEVNKMFIISAVNMQKGWSVTFAVRTVSYGPVN